MLRHQSEREVLRSRLRTIAAMAAQIRQQGRNLGGRPPYGYRLVDAGPHPRPCTPAGAAVSTASIPAGDRPDREVDVRMK